MTWDCDQSRLLFFKLYECRYRFQKSPLENFFGQIIAVYQSPKILSWDSRDYF